MLFFRASSLDLLMMGEVVYPLGERHVQVVGVLSIPLGHMLVGGILGNPLVAIHAHLTWLLVQDAPTSWLFE